MKYKTCKTVVAIVCKLTFQETLAISESLTITRKSNEMLDVGKSNVVSSTQIALHKLMRLIYMFSKELRHFLSFKMEIQVDHNAISQLSDFIKTLVVRLHQHSQKFN